MNKSKKENNGTVKQFLIQIDGRSGLNQSYGSLYSVILFIISFSEKLDHIRGLYLLLLEAKKKKYLSDHYPES